MIEGSEEVEEGRNEDARGRIMWLCSGAWVAEVRRSVRKDLRHTYGAMIPFPLQVVGIHCANTTYVHSLP